MILCSANCIPCCDFCVHVIHDEWNEYMGYWATPKHIVGGPIGCKLHPDEEHQEIAEGCGFCDDFHCFKAKEEEK